MVNDHLTVVRNPDYWRPDLPYLDEIEFRPVVESSVRLNAVRAGQLTIAHDFDPGDIVFARREAKSGRIDLFESYRAPELSYVMLNVTKSPFDDVRARRALAHAVNRDELNNILSQGILRVADGPFDKGVMSHVDDSGFPGHDLKRARELVEEYEAEKGPLAFTLLGTPDPRVVRLVELVQSQAREAGIDVQLQLFEQAQLISTALGGGFQATAWRNHGGTDPDYQYVWWRGGSPVNFGRFDDPEINRILDAGRSATNPAEREALYQGLSRRFGEQVYDVWITYLLWGILSRPEVRGIGGPELPTDGRANIQGAGHPTIGLWVDK